MPFVSANSNPSARSAELMPCASGVDTDQAVVGQGWIRGLAVPLPRTQCSCRAAPTLPPRLLRQPALRSLSTPTPTADGVPLYRIGVGVRDKVCKGGARELLDRSAHLR